MSFMCAVIPSQPALPLDVDPKEPERSGEESRYIIPVGIRPMLRKYRIEVQKHDLEQK